MVFENYNQEIENKWGNTKEYKEYLEKTKNYSKDKFEILSKKMDNIFESFANYMKNGYSESSNEVLNLVNVLKNFITDNYYLCTNDILLYFPLFFNTFLKF